MVSPFQNFIRAVQLSGYPTFWPTSWHNSCFQPPFLAVPLSFPHRVLLSSATVRTEQPCSSRSESPHVMSNNSMDECRGLWLTQKASKKRQRRKRCSTTSDMVYDSVMSQIEQDLSEADSEKSDASESESSSEEESETKTRHCHQRQQKRMKLTHQIFRRQYENDDSMETVVHSY